MALHFFEASQLRSPAGTISNLSHFSLVANYAYHTPQAYHYICTALHHRWSRRASNGCLQGRCMIHTHMACSTCREPL